MLQLASCALFLAALCVSAQHSPPESTGVSAFVRHFLPGGSFANRWHMLTSRPFNSTHTATGFRGPVKLRPDGLKEQTFLSTPVTMAPGEVVNNYAPLDWPEGHIALRAYTGDMVKLAPGADLHAVGSDGLPEVVTAPREEVYQHHWTIGKWQSKREFYDELVKQGSREFDENDVDLVKWDAGVNSGANNACGPAQLHFLFGAGNEIRGPGSGAHGEAIWFPDPYGLESDSQAMHREGIFAMLNQHLIDIRGVSNRRGCTECECSVTGATRRPSANYTGGLACCHSTHYDGGRCAVAPGTNPVNQTYFIQYKVVWRDLGDAFYKSTPFKSLEPVVFEISDDSEHWFDPVALQGSVPEAHTALKADPVSLASIASGHSGLFSSVPKRCHVEYWVPPCKASDACIHKFHNSWSMAFAGEIVSVVGHFHYGARNLTTSVNGRPICTNLPSYGKGFLTEISACTFGEEFSAPVKVAKGDTIQVEAVYDQDDKPHFGVMGFSTLSFHREQPSSRPDKLADNVADGDIFVGRCRAAGGASRTGLRLSFGKWPSAGVIELLPASTSSSPTPGCTWKRAFAGEWSSETRTYELSLGEWIGAPCHHEASSWLGMITADGQRFSGASNATYCSSFRAVKQSRGILV